METETATSFKIQHEHFEGPIEVLLEMVEKRKLFVNDISLAAVTDDFIVYIQQHGMASDMVGQFLAVAATLILIKARSLLPNLELTVEEKESITDLERRLALFQIISQVQVDLSKAYGKKILYAGTPQKQSVVFVPDKQITKESLAPMLQGLFASVPVVEKKPETRVYKTISITEVLATLEDRITRAMSSLNFKDIVVQDPDGDTRTQKVYTIVSFLGMLELVRRGIVLADQDDGFGDITLSKQQTSQDIQTHE